MVDASTSIGIGDDDDCNDSISKKGERKVSERILTGNTTTSSSRRRGGPPLGPNQCDSLPKLVPMFMQQAMPGVRQDAITMIESSIFQPKSVFPPEGLDEKEALQHKAMFDSRINLVQCMTFYLFINLIINHSLNRFALFWRSNRLSDLH